MRMNICIFKNSTYYIYKADRFCTNSKARYRCLQLMFELFMVTLHLRKFFNSFTYMFTQMFLSFRPNAPFIHVNTLNELITQIPASVSWLRTPVSVALAQLKTQQRLKQFAVLLIKLNYTYYYVDGKNIYILILLEAELKSIQFIYRFLFWFL